jgi:transposase
MAYSLDFRKRVMLIKKGQDLTFEKTSERFGIGIRTLFRWQNRMEPKTTRNKPATKINTEKLAEDVKKYPDDFQYERAKRFGVSQWGIDLALRRLGITYKKNPESSQS